MLHLSDGLLATDFFCYVFMSAENTPIEITFIFFSCYSLTGQFQGKMLTGIDSKVADK